MANLDRDPPRELGAAMECGDQTPVTRTEQAQSDQIREEEMGDLKEAAQQTLNIILDLGLDGVIRWVSPSWAEVVGTPSDAVQGKPVADILLDNTTAFADAVESLKKDDSRSQIIRFSVRMGPLSKLLPPSSGRSTATESLDGTQATAEALAEQDPTAEGDDEADVNTTLMLEGQGIMVTERTSGSASHVN